MNVGVGLGRCADKQRDIGDADMGGLECCTVLTHLGSFRVPISGPVLRNQTGDNSEPFQTHTWCISGALLMV